MLKCENCITGRIITYLLSCRLAVLFIWAECNVCIKYNQMCCYHNVVMQVLLCSYQYTRVLTVQL